MYWIGDANYKGTNALFYQGVETKDMPKNGEFTYLGKVVAILLNMAWNLQVMPILRLILRRKN